MITMKNATAAILVDTFSLFTSVLNPKKKLKTITTNVDTSIIVNKAIVTINIFLIDLFFIWL